MTSRKSYIWTRVFCLIFGMGLFGLQETTSTICAAGIQFQIQGQADSAYFQSPGLPPRVTSYPVTVIRDGKSFSVEISDPRQPESVPISAKTVRPYKRVYHFDGLDSRHIKYFPKIIGTKSQEKQIPYQDSAEISKGIVPPRNDPVAFYVWSAYVFGDYLSSKSNFTIPSPILLQSYDLKVIPESLLSQGQFPKSYQLIHPGELAAPALVGSRAPGPKSAKQVTLPAPFQTGYVAVAYSATAWTNGYIPAGFEATSYYLSRNATNLAPEVRVGHRVTFQTHQYLDRPQLKDFSPRLVAKTEVQEKRIKSFGAPVAYVTTDKVIPRADSGRAQEEIARRKALVSKIKNPDRSVGTIICLTTLSVAMLIGLFYFRKQVAKTMQ